MALNTAPAPTTPPAGISPDTFLSSLGRTLAMVGLLTIFTLAITAIVKIVATYVVKKLRQLFRPPADPVEIPEAGQPADPEEIVGEYAILPNGKRLMCNGNLPNPRRFMRRRFRMSF